MGLGACADTRRGRKPRSVSDREDGKSRAHLRQGGIHAIIRRGDADVLRRLESTFDIHCGGDGPLNVVCRRVIRSSCVREESPEDRTGPSRSVESQTTYARRSGDEFPLLICAPPLRGRSSIKVAGALTHRGVVFLPDSFEFQSGWWPVGCSWTFVGLSLQSHGCAQDRTHLDMIERCGVGRRYRPERAATRGGVEWLDVDHSRWHASVGGWW